MNMADDAEYCYILEADLIYSEKYHDEHSDLLLCPEHLTFSENMLSHYCNEILLH